MKKYEVLLGRSYIVTVCAQNHDTARRCVEFYLGDCPDLSKSIDRKDLGFEIKEMEMTVNEAFEAREII